tara:strand:+ start:42 stop:215 length:174 start_codon:yes stop_codon:yes gene_type:complete
MIHNHHSLDDIKRKNYVVTMDNNSEYIVRAVDSWEAAFQADDLAKLMDEELKDIKPL